MHRTNQYDWLGATHPYTFQFIDLRLPAGSPAHHCKENKHRCFVKQAANQLSIFEVNANNARLTYPTQVVSGEQIETLLPTGATTPLISRIMAIACIHRP